MTGSIFQVKKWSQVDDRIRSPLRAIVSESMIYIEELRADDGAEIVFYSKKKNLVQDLESYTYKGVKFIDHLEMEVDVWFKDDKYYRVVGHVPRPVRRIECEPFDVPNEAVQPADRMIISLDVVTAFSDFADGIVSDLVLDMIRAGELLCLEEDRDDVNAQIYFYRNVGELIDKLSNYTLYSNKFWAIPEEVEECDDYNDEETLGNVTCQCFFIRGLTDATLINEEFGVNLELNPASDSCVDVRRISRFVLENNRLPNRESWHGVSRAHRNWLTSLIE